MAYTAKKILITGASGFIGSFLVEQVLAEGYEVWAAVRSTTSRRYLQDERIRFVERNTRSCPYYRYYDEYKSVQKQN